MKNETNPFNISFGTEPLQKISRPNESNEIIYSFENENPESNTYILTGPRGCGKTIMLSSLRSYFSAQKNWVCVDLISYKDILELFASTLYEEGKLKKLFTKKEFSFSFKGVSFSINGDKPVTNVITMLTIMLDYLKKQNKKILICIDEISPNNEIRAFIQAFQLFLNKNLPVYLLMTGLYSNVSSLENERNMTFLLRAPKIFLSPLNKEMISKIYQSTLDVSDKEAINLSKFTKGYAFAYQLLGNILYKMNKKLIDEEVLFEFDSLIRERAYFKIYEELTEKEKEILKFASKDGNEINKKIIEGLSLKAGTLSTYKKRLEDKGVIKTSKRGKLDWALPRFKEYLQYLSIYED